jgi:HD-GYP domain-containing protein (c-di-GMP phosphodiesterase class II)
VDVFDALTSDRPYRTAMTTEEALDYLGKQAGIHFDPQVVSRFTAMIHDSSAPNTGTLNTGTLDTGSLNAPDPAAGK